MQIVHCDDTHQVMPQEINSLILSVAQTMSPISQESNWLCMHVYCFMHAPMHMPMYLYISSSLICIAASPVTCTYKIQKNLGNMNKRLINECLIWWCAPVWAGVVIELALGWEDDEPNLDIAEDGELIGLLQEAGAPLGEAHLPTRLVLDPPQLHSPPPHY